MSNPILRQKLAEKAFFFAPGIHDMISAVIARRIGFDAVYASGYWMTASAYGLPDAGIATYTQMVDRAGTLARTMPEAAVIADADTGYGGLLNVHHTVRGFEEAGITAIQIEDQEFPKKCGHTPFKRVIPVKDMADKVKVAVEARRDPNTLIIARTDAHQSEGLDGALRRGEAYAAAGADIVFVEALTTDAEMRKACETIAAPLMANMAQGGKTPMRSAKELQEIGYACAIYPATSALSAAAAVERTLMTMKATGATPDPTQPMFDFNEFCRLIGFEEVWAFEKRWGGVESAAAE